VYVCRIEMKVRKGLSQCGGKKQSLEFFRDSFKETCPSLAEMCEVCSGFCGEVHTSDKRAP